MKAKVNVLAKPHPYIFLGEIEWGCQISWGAKYPVTPAQNVCFTGIH